LIPARETAFLMAWAPSWTAVWLAREPRNIPVGVRTAETM
jgi:hypothetical protein